MPTREDAWKLLCEYTQSESLRKHMLAVEACVRAYARKNGADEDLWGLAALLHDFDYERWPNNDHAPDREHPAEGAKILREHGYNEELDSRHSLPRGILRCRPARLLSSTRCSPATNLPAFSPPALTSVLPKASSILKSARSKNE